MFARSLGLMTAASVIALVFLSPASHAQDLKRIADKAIRWLGDRANEDGSYGSGQHKTEVTAAALTGFAFGPRRYRADDGPFFRNGLRFLLGQQKDSGAFGDGESAHRATGIAVMLLEEIDPEKYASQIKKAKSSLGSQSPRDSVSRYLEWAGLPSEAAAWTQGSSAISSVADAQKPDGSWSGGPSDVAHTAGAVLMVALASRSSSSSGKKNIDQMAARAMKSGVDYLLSNQEGGKWSMGGEADLGLTAMAISAILRSPVRSDEAKKAIDQALEFIRSNAKPDGGIHQGNLQNYQTCVSVMALKLADRPEDRETIQKAARYIKSLQLTGDHGYSESDKFYGGIGYGGNQRPDLSNLQFSLQALDAAGVSAEDKAIQDALIFLQRCQNRSESNDLQVETPDGKTVQAGNDGGGYYYPGDSSAGLDKNPDGTYTARSYGAMTYALLRGYLFAGLPADDARVQQAVHWIENNYTVEYNPGFDMLADATLAYQGLYYYYVTMAKALDALGRDDIEDSNGQSRDWRADLTEKLVSLQNEDGSWVNETKGRWWESNPVLVTSYAVQALSHCFDGQQQDAGQR
ncbi:MAG: prenyltransferase/squalene oxidase repeat-containing protein [Planctomycetota bacterium]